MASNLTAFLISYDESDNKGRREILHKLKLKFAEGSSAGEGWGYETESRLKV